MRALLLMQQNIDTPLSVAELAKRMGHSKRQLERHFRSALGPRRRPRSCRSG